jgi:hypothetical protein
MIIGTTPVSSGRGGELTFGIAAPPLFGGDQIVAAVTQGVEVGELFLAQRAG